MKGYLIPILVVILAIGIIFEVGCDSMDSESTSTDNQQQIAEPPKVIEKDVEVEVIYGNKDPNWLYFPLNVGDRVEGEVYVSHSESIVVGQVRDPYGNIIVQTSHITFHGEYWENSGFPWRFAFIAYTDGEYVLQVFSFTTLHGSQPSAHLKITCYENE